MGAMRQKYRTTFNKKIGKKENYFNHNSISDLQEIMHSTQQQQHLHPKDVKGV